MPGFKLCVRGQSPVVWTNQGLVLAAWVGIWFSDSIGGATASSG